MGAGIWLATVLVVAVSNDPAAAAGVGRGDHEALGLGAMEVVDDEAFGHEIRGTNVGLDQLIGITLLSQSARNASAPANNVTNANDRNVATGMASVADEAPRIAQYTFVIRWLVLTTGSDSLSRLDRNARR